MALRKHNQYPTTFGLAQPRPVRVRKATRHSSHVKPNQSNKNLNPFRWLIFVIILLAIGLVIIAIVCIVLLRPERQIPQKLASLAANYYENHYYPNLTQSSTYAGSPVTALADHAESGLPVVNLRQIILLGDQKNTPNADYVLKYCDESTTTIKFYPE